MRVLGKVWAGLGASKTRRVMTVAALLCLVLTVQIVTYKTRTVATIEDPTMSQRLMPILDQQAMSTSAPETGNAASDNSTPKADKVLDKIRSNRPVEAQRTHRRNIAMQSKQNLAKDQIMKNLSTMDAKQLQKLLRLFDSTKDPNAVPEIRITQALQALKVKLLEDVTGQTYPDIMDAAKNARAISQQTRPQSLQIVISTTWRSGSTFLEELLASHPAVYNHYEPLMQFGLRQIRGGSDGTKAQKLVHELLHCNYNELDDYISTARKILDMFSRNTMLWHSCFSEEYDKAMCYNKVFLKGACQLFPWSTMKLVRLRLKLLRPILEDSALNARIIYLVRDPRGVINSRASTVKWCSSDDCKNPATLCGDMDDDLTSALELQHAFPGKVYILRYEDMALNPFNKTEELLRYLELDFDPSMKQFLETHTTKNYDKPWSTSRESKKRVTHWVGKLSTGKVQEVQRACEPVMKKFGYLTVNSTKSVTLADILKPLIVPRS